MEVTFGIIYSNLKDDLKGNLLRIEYITTDFQGLAKCFQKLAPPTGLMVENCWSKLNSSEMKSQ